MLMNRMIRNIVIIPLIFHIERETKVVKRTTDATDTWTASFNENDMRYSIPQDYSTYEY